MILSVLFENARQFTNKRFLYSMSISEIDNRVCTVIQNARTQMQELHKRDQFQNSLPFLGYTLMFCITNMETLENVN